MAEALEGKALRDQQGQFSTLNRTQEKMALPAYLADRVLMERQDRLAQPELLDQRSILKPSLASKESLGFLVVKGLMAQRDLQAHKGLLDLPYIFRLILAKTASAAHRGRLGRMARMGRTVRRERKGRWGLPCTWRRNQETMGCQGRLGRQGLKVRQEPVAAICRIALGRLPF